MLLRRSIAAQAAHPRQALAGAAWLLLWLALCLAPWVGRMHQVLHPLGAHGQPLRVAASGSIADTGDLHAQAHAHDPWHQHHGSDCLLLDHLALADALCSTVQTLAEAPPQADRAAVPPTGVRLPPLRGFEARAPPTLVRA